VTATTPAVYAGHQAANPGRTPQAKEPLKMKELEQIERIVEAQATAIDTLGDGFHALTKEFAELHNKIDALIARIKLIERNWE